MGPNSFMTDFLVGGVSGAIAKTVTAPIDRVKVLIQTQDANPRVRSGEVERYKGIVDCSRRVYTEQGMPAFWRGNLTNILRYFPTQAFNFAFKDSIKAQFPRYDSEREFWSFLAVNMASGGLAGAGSLTIVYPLDYARTRLASDVGKGGREFTGLVDCLTKTAKGPKGVLGLYNGFGVSVAGIIPYRGTYFGVFDTLKTKNPYKKDLGFIGFASKFLVAQVSAITASYVSYPLETVRRRLQMQSGKPKDKCLYEGTSDCFKKIVANEGPTALFKGAGANAIRTVGAALVLVLYDTLQTYIKYAADQSSESPMKHGS
ncbi:hypothetical protein DIPPA_25888 [Diplonema papillatum]|nr:hypothetical protein DIPPA_25888 [Diplonema papillatum]